MTLADGECRAKGDKGTGAVKLHRAVEVVKEGDSLHIKRLGDSREQREMAGTMRALLANLVKGVSEGFVRELEIHGVGYRARVEGKTVKMTLGFSHPVEYPIPQGITIKAPNQTTLIIEGSDRQQVGQIAAEIRRLRPPEPYGGKGVRYMGEHILRKELKKKK